MNNPGEMLPFKSLNKAFSKFYRLCRQYEDVAFKIKYRNYEGGRYVFDDMTYLQFSIADRDNHRIINSNLKVEITLSKDFMNTYQKKYTEFIKSISNLNFEMEETPYNCVFTFQEGTNGYGTFQLLYVFISHFQMYFDDSTFFYSYEISKGDPKTITLDPNLKAAPSIKRLLDKSLSLIPLTEDEINIDFTKTDGSFLLGVNIENENNNPQLSFEELIGDISHLEKWESYPNHTAFQLDMFENNLYNKIVIPFVDTDFCAKFLTDYILYLSPGLNPDDITGSIPDENGIDFYDSENLPKFLKEKGLENIVDEILKDLNDLNLGKTEWDSFNPADYDFDDDDELPF